MVCSSIPVSKKPFRAHKSFVIHHAMIVNRAKLIQTGKENRINVIAKHYSTHKIAQQGIKRANSLTIVRFIPIVPRRS
jgi:hypothetical protein